MVALVSPDNTSQSHLLSGMADYPAALRYISCHHLLVESSCGVYYFPRLRCQHPICNLRTRKIQQAHSSDWIDPCLQFLHTLGDGLTRLVLVAGVQPSRELLAQTHGIRGHVLRWAKFQPHPTEIPVGTYTSQVQCTMVDSVCGV